MNEDKLFGAAKTIHYRLTCIVTMETLTCNQLESSNGPLHKISKGQRQRRNRSLKKVKMARDQADFNRTLRHQPRHDPPQHIPDTTDSHPDILSHTRPTATPSFPLPDPPFSTQPYVTTSIPHSDLGIRYVPTLRSRAAWMIDEGDERIEAQADADWYRVTHQLLGHPRPAPYILPSPAILLPNPKKGEAVERWHRCLPLPGVMHHPTDREPIALLVHMRTGVDSPMHPFSYISRSTRIQTSRSLALTSPTTSRRFKNTYKDT
jgi:hypothetical protein